MTTHPLSVWLVLLGALPFVACALLPIFGWTQVPVLGSTDLIAASYGLAIASFVAGTHWGIAVQTDNSVPINLFVSSNVALLAAWFAFIGASTNWQLVAQIIVFAFLWMIDRRLRQAELISADYYRLRSIATTIVCASLSVTVAVP
ncbi:MAG: DUF3429 domain-containing protein [Pseudomonadota bacterium]